jgi:hypothetical protein
MTSRVRALLLVAALAGCAHGAGNPYADWVAVRTYSFTVYTNTSPGTYRDIVDEIEALNAALVKGFFPSTELRGIDVVLFADPEAEKKAVKHADTPFVRPDADPIVLTVRPNGPRRGRDRNASLYSTHPEQQMSTALVRRMLAANMRNAPPWFRVGLEEYAETVEIQGNLARFGHRLPRTTHELAVGRVIPLGQLIAAGPHDFHGGEWRLDHRASAWAFIHYLLGGQRGELRPRFDVLARALIEADDAGPQASRAAIAKAFPDVDFATLEGRVHDYAVGELGQRSYFHPMTIQFVAPPHRDYPTEAADPQRVQGLLSGLRP